MIKTSTAKKIKRICLEKGISLKQLNDMMGKNDNYVYNKLSRENFSEKDLLFFADCLDCDLEITFIDKESGEKY